MSDPSRPVRELPVDPVPRHAFRPAEAARSMGISKRALDTLILDKTSGIPIVRIGRSVLHPVRELREWLTGRVKGGKP